MVEVLYVDNHLLVLHKPAGMLTQPNESCDPSLEEWGKMWLKEQFSKPGKVFLQAIHRLDRPVSGVVLLARTSKAVSRLNESQRKGLFEKRYTALVEGFLESPEGVLEHYLEKGAFHAYLVEEEGKQCRLKYQVQKTVGYHTLLDIKLLTGRYHQIRAQLAAIGHPIVGDQKYGSKSSEQYLFLHHSSLNFPHPVTQESLSFQAELPDFWHNCL